ncbi:hypothetical protein BCR44DRAFT_1442287 [Catenaria anguillulae PL171]|uniref:DUF4246 domain-containing protein n=1 Tax=Catenaria anguillulae PL171 TaxID=765915 RepID=A0A1Y2HBV7_9FUNG|nr:hypothetical protein BCR44DRAFT_1442287 [Catenaria anguillulae PL171]
MSSQFQWLPAEIQVDAKGKSAQFVSYINNLHPDDHPELYQVLGDVFASMLPMFEQALVRIDCPRPIRICTAPDFWYNTVPVESGESEQDFIGSDDDFAGVAAGDEQQEEAEEEEEDVGNWDDPRRKINHKNDNLPMFTIGGDGDPGADCDDPMDVDTASESEEIMTAAEMLEEVESATESESEDPSYVGREFEDEDQEYPYEKYWTNALTDFMTAPIGVTGQPEGITSFGDDSYARVYRPKVPRRFVPPAPVDVPTMSPHSQLAGKRLQVIVKLANIHLTPDNPTYPGGSWHVEGMLNESIIATGLYYYAMDNITESRLHFRSFVQPPTVDHQQHYVLSDIYGLHTPNMGYVLCQGKGYITAHEGRAVVFPNMYQHKVFPFELEDKSRPGYRKILAFFLIDPARSESGDVLSSAVVPPQQADWLAREFVKDPTNPLASKLPVELVEMIGDKVAMTMEQAKEIRLELMEERSMSASTSNELTYGAEYNLCEH